MDLELKYLDIVLDLCYWYIYFGTQLNNEFNFVNIIYDFIFEWV